MGGEGYDVFLSYSRADDAAAETLRSRLKGAGLSAFLDRYALPAGQPWQPWLEHQIGSCSALIVLVGPQGFGEWQHREIELGLDRQASAAKAGEQFPVIPALLPGLANDAIPVGTFLALNTWVDLRKGLDEPESFQRLVAGAQGKPIDAAAAEKLIAGLTPYRGLLPFREQDAGLFFGRERFVAELVEKVSRRTATNVVAVIGRSGSGKSSIVFAGLLPALRREKGLSGQSVWKVVDLRPYDEPLHQLARAFDPPKAEPGSVAYRAQLNEAAKLFRDRKLTLAEIVRDRLRDEPGSTRLLLYVDQSEELYTQAAPREPKSDEERARAADVKLFINLVLDAAASSPCTLVLSARSDFYPDIQTHDRLRVTVQDSQVSLGSMNETELRAVIEGPPKALGASVDPELTQKLVRDIGLDPASGPGDEYDIGKLPLLEYALEQAWEKRTGARIGTAEYAGLEQALEERANALYGRLSADEQAAAKRLFVSLVTPGEGREDTRARIDMPDDAAMRKVIDTFAGGEARLLVTDQSEGRRSVEVSHEALIRHWKELRQWIDENRDKLRTRARLKDDRAEWLKRNKDPDLLSIPGFRLREVQKLADDPGDVRTDDIKDYIDALLDRDRRRKEEEEQRREAYRRQKEEEEQKREADRRRNRLLFLTTLAAGSLILVLLHLGIPTIFTIGREPPAGLIVFVNVSLAAIEFFVFVIIFLCVFYSQSILYYITIMLILMNMMLVISVPAFILYTQYNDMSAGGMVLSLFLVILITLFPFLADARSMAISLGGMILSLLIAVVLSYLTVNTQNPFFYLLDDSFIAPLIWGVGVSLSGLMALGSAIFLRRSRSGYQ